MPSQHSPHLAFALAGLVFYSAGCWGAHEIDQPLAFVDRSVPLSEECELNLDESLATGLYDVNAGSGFCARDFDAHLRVGTFLTIGEGERLCHCEPSVLQIHSVAVTLLDQARHLIEFDSLPNPFEQITRVSLFPISDEEPVVTAFTMHAIPSAYADSLKEFAGKTIVAEIALFGTTAADEDVEFDVFSYPIEICDGCLTACASDFPVDARPRDVCDDDGGQDGRICYDRGC